MLIKAPELKIEGTATIGTKGQLVIPKGVRKQFGLTPGTDVIILSTFVATIIIKSENLPKMIKHFEKITQIFRKTKD